MTAGGAPQTDAPAPVRRMCADCGQPFVIGAEEQRWFQNLAAQRPDLSVVWPNRCTLCRFERRRALLAVVDDGIDEQLECSSCGCSFAFGGRDKQFWAQRGWLRPRRCRPCRAAARAAGR